MEAYIWDLDGTLLDSYDVIVEAAARTAEDAGVRDDKGDVLKAVKQGSVSAYLKDVSARTGETTEDLFQRYRTYTHGMDDRIGLVDGAGEALERLQRAGAIHFVYTHFFREVVTSEYGFSAKPSGEGVRYLLEKYGLDPAQTWYAGDRTLDVFCAKDAGVRALLYLPADSCVSATGKEDRIIRDMWEL